MYTRVRVLVCRTERGRRNTRRRRLDKAIMEAIILEIVALRRLLVHCTARAVWHRQGMQRGESVTHSSLPKPLVTRGQAPPEAATRQTVPSRPSVRHAIATSHGWRASEFQSNTYQRDTHPPIDQPRGFRKPATMEVGLAPRTGTASLAFRWLERATRGERRGEPAGVRSASARAWPIPRPTTEGDRVRRQEREVGGKEKAGGTRPARGLHSTSHLAWGVASGPGPAPAHRSQGHPWEPERGNCPRTRLPPAAAGLRARGADGDVGR